MSVHGRIECRVRAWPMPWFEGRVRAWYMPWSESRVRAWPMPWFGIV